MNMPIARNVFDFYHVGAAVLYSALGLAVFSIAFVIVDKKTPYNLWQEIVQKQNMALAIIVAGLSIAMSIIVAASIVG
jgi:uncharacterized membrane protein YjfL (UPF0719 family)